MAREKALSILSGQDKDDLQEIQGGMIQNLQRVALSQNYKEKKYSGDINAGSVEFSRFANAKSKKYGTARNGGKGDLLNNKGKVAVNLNTNEEIVEEANKFDVDKKGIPGLFKERSGNHTLSMLRVLDRAFFNEAETAGKAVTLKEKTIEGQVEELIQTLEKLENDFVDGVERDQMVLFLNPGLYGKLRNYIDKTQNAVVDGGVEEINSFHGVEVRSNTRQKKDAIVMVKGAIAQPVSVEDYDLEKIPLSNDYAMELFYKYGTKALTPDLIFVATVAEEKASTNGK